MSYKNLFLKGIRIGVILILFTPLVLGPFGLSLSNYPKAVFFRSLIEIIFVFYLLLIFFNSQYLPKISVLVLAVSVYIGILFITSLTGFNFYRSFWGDLHRVEGVVLHLHLLIFFLILISVFREKKDWILFFKLSVIVSAFSSFAGILQKLQVARFYGVSLPERISGTWTNPDFFAPYILLTIFLGIFLLLIEKDKNWKILLVFVLVLNFFTLILSGTRAAWIGLVFGMFFLFLVWFFSAPALEPKKRKLILFGTLFFCLFLLLLFLSQDILSLNKSPLFQRALSIFNIDTLSHSARLPVWQIALAAWKEKPILGWGPESFTYVFDKYFKTEYLQYIGESIHFDKPHNKVLEVMAATGIVGLLSYFAIFLVAFYLLWRFRKTSPIFSLVFSALFISYFIGNLFCFDTLGTYLIFFLALGFINNCSFPQKTILSPDKSKPTALKLLLVPFLVLISLLSFYQINFKPTIASLAFIRAFNEKNFQKSLIQYKEGINKKNLYDQDFKKELTKQLISVLENNEPPKEIEKEIVGTLIGLKYFLEKKLGVPERHYLESYELVTRINERIYLLNQDPEFLEKMEEIINQVLAFNNQRPELYRLLGEKKILQGSFSEGETYFQKSFEMGRQSFEDRIYFYRRLGKAYLKAGNKKMAAENFKKALDIDFALKKFKEISSKETREKEAQEILVFAQNLARFYYQELNDLETCRKIYEKAMEIFPDYKKQLRFNLETLIQ